MNLKDYIASIENYPQEGITFRDISPLMANGNAYSYAVREIVQYATDKKIDMIVGPEARGFMVTLGAWARMMKELNTAKIKTVIKNVGISRKDIDRLFKLSNKYMLWIYEEIAFAELL